MVSISCYTIHSILAKYIRIWKIIQLVTEFMATMVLSILCPCNDQDPMAYVDEAGDQMYGVHVDRNRYYTKPIPTFKKNCPIKIRDLDSGDIDLETEAIPDYLWSTPVLKDSLAYNDGPNLREPVQVHKKLPRSSRCGVNQRDKTKCEDIMYVEC